MCKDQRSAIAKVGVWASQLAIPGHLRQVPVIGSSKLLWVGTQKAVYLDALVLKHGSAGSRCRTYHVGQPARGGIGTA